MWLSHDSVTNARICAKMQQLLKASALAVYMQAEVEARPLLYNNIMTVTADDTPVYNGVPSYEALRKVLDDKMAEYNESNAVMELVLFQQAMEHICRITRIISLPRGNAMLVGVGGSGKQSLARYVVLFTLSLLASIEAMQCCHHSPFALVAPSVSSANP